MAGYGLGVLAGRAVVGENPDDQRIWPWRSTLTMIVVAAASTGMQSTAVRQLGKMSTTYLTSTLAGLVGAPTTPSGRSASPA